METIEPTSPVVPVANTPDDLARRHRAAWAAAACDGLRTLDLGAGGDALSALEAAREGDAATWEAIAWLDGVPPEGPPPEVLERLREAAGAGARIVLAVPADAKAFGPDAARALAGAFGAAVLAQRFAGASLIHPLDELPIEVAATVEDAAVSDPGDARAWLVAVNVPPQVLDEAAQTVAALSLAPVHASYLQRLEASNAGLRRANARLAREHLGRHDSAAASVIWKLERARDDAQEHAAALEDEVARLKDRLAAETEIAQRNDQYFQDARHQLMTRPHRVVSGLERRLGRVPGLRKLFA